MKVNDPLLFYSTLVNEGFETEKRKFLNHITAKAGVDGLRIDYDTMIASWYIQTSNADYKFFEKSFYSYLQDQSKSNVVFAKRQIDDYVMSAGVLDIIQFIKKILINSDYIVRKFQATSNRNYYIPIQEIKEIKSFVLDKYTLYIESSSLDDSRGEKGIFLNKPTLPYKGDIPLPTFIQTLLLSMGKFIGGCEENHFLQLFEEPLGQIEPIKWLDVGRNKKPNKVTLFYFFETLEMQGFIAETTQNQIIEIIKSYFVDKDGTPFKNLQESYANFKKEAKTETANKKEIEEIVVKIAKLS